jgi:hypothetical protein
MDLALVAGTSFFPLFVPTLTSDIASHQGMPGHSHRAQGDLCHLLHYHLLLGDLDNGERVFDPIDGNTSSDGGFNQGPTPKAV